MAIRASSHSDEVVQSHLIVMLTVVFLILAFFSVTWTAPRPEANFNVAVPPITLAEMRRGRRLLELRVEKSAVTVTLRASPTGSLTSIAVDNTAVSDGMPMLAHALGRQIQRLEPLVGNSIDAAEILVDPQLKYRHVIAAVEACHAVGIHKIKFGETQRSTDPPDSPVG